MGTDLVAMCQVIEIVCDLDFVGPVHHWSDGLTPTYPTAPAMRIERLDIASASRLDE